MSRQTVIKALLEWIYYIPLSGLNAQAGTVVANYNHSNKTPAC